MPTFIFVQNILSKILGRVVLRRQLVKKNFTFQNSVVSCAWTPTLHQGMQKIVRLMRTVQIVGINAFHLAHHKTYDEGVRKELPDAMYFGCLGKNALFWRRPQRGAGTGGGRAVRGGQA